MIDSQSATKEPAPDVMRYSFRDPDGMVFPRDGRIFRVVNDSGLATIENITRSKIAESYIAGGRLVRSARVPESEARSLLSGMALGSLDSSFRAAAVFEHEKIPFPAFPYEWSPEMLAAAGRLTLQLTRDCLAEGIGLKDATPLNVLFSGSQPVFVDMLSFERREPEDPRWLPYAQFVRAFLLPLIVNKKFGTPLNQIFLGRRDGLEPEEVYRTLRPLDRIKPLFLTNVSVPVWLASRHNQQDTAIYQKARVADPEKARYIIDSLLGRLQRAVAKASPATDRRSTWTEYMEGQNRNNYSGEQLEVKKRFVADALREFSSKSVLDVGCNTGVFSTVAAKSGAAVVAIDYDPVVVGRLWRKARAEKLNILPLVVDLTRPSPALGWMNEEWPSFLERARAHFDGVLMLAVIHHMLVTERVPLREIIRMAAGLTTGIAIIEFVEPDDSMFRQLTRGREHLHRDLTVNRFELECRARFDIVRAVRLPGSLRSLYLLRKKGR